MDSTVSVSHSMQNSSHVVVINNSPCKMVLSGSFNAKISPFGEQYIDEIVNGRNYAWKFQPEDCEIEYSLSEIYDWIADSLQEFVMVTIAENKVIAMKNPITAIKDASKGHATFQLFFNLKNKLAAGKTVSFLLQGPEDYIFQSRKTKDATFVGLTNGSNISPGKYKIYPSFNDTAFSEVSFKSFHIKSGCKYALSMYEARTEPYKITSSLYLLIQDNIIPILYLLPQYFLVTAGEIMMSVTGLEFSYSQSPKSMKAVLQASWLLTVGFGNLIVIIVTKIKIFETQSYEFFMFAFLMSLDMLIFGLMAFFYKYVVAHNQEERPDVTTTEVK